MNVLLLQVFVSLCLVAGSVVLYVWSVRERTLDHADRLALAPLDDDIPHCGALPVGTTAIDVHEPVPEEVP